MKKLAVVITLIIGTLMLARACSDIGKGIYYANGFMRADYESGTITFDLENGQRYCWSIDSDDHFLWHCSDVMVKMDNAGTPDDPEDDIILSWSYVID